MNRRRRYANYAKPSAELHREVREAASSFRISALLEEQKQRDFTTIAFVRA